MSHPSPTFSASVRAAEVLTPLDRPHGADTWHSLRSGRTVEDAGLIDNTVLREHLASAPAAALPPHADRATQLALAATLSLLRSLGGLPPGTALFVGTSKGPILSQLAAADFLHRNPHTPLPIHLARAVVLGPHAIALDLQQAITNYQLPITVPSIPLHTSVAACSSGLHAFHRAVRAIEQGEIEHAIVVAADASHHPLLEASFARLGVLAPPDPDGHRRCRPFDPRGRGFIVSEAAAAILLTRSTPHDALVTVDRTTIAGDGTALIAIDPHSDSLRQTLRSLSPLSPFPSPLSFVHAHATGTAHDAFELAAIRETCGRVPVISSKQWLGHALGAAGLVSVALSHRSHREGMLWDGTPVAPGCRSITISQGFGGHIAAVSLRGQTFH